MYNMDEKGIQLGGGWQLDETRYYVKDQSICLKTQNANLKLVTTIECVAVNGSNIKPAFVLFEWQNTQYEEYFEEEGIM